MFLLEAFCIVLIAVFIYYVCIRRGGHSKDQLYLDNIINEHIKFRDSKNIVTDKCKLWIKDRTLGVPFPLDLEENPYVVWHPVSPPKYNTGNCFPNLVYTDSLITNAQEDNDSSEKYAWFYESPAVIPRDVKRAKRWGVKKRFKRIFTHYDCLLALGDPFVFVPFGGTFIRKEDFGICEKRLNLSLIASNKRWLPGHSLRHDIVERYKSRIDRVLGGGYDYVENKADGLKPYRYTIAIENCKQDYHFTEKLIDSFLTGTVPIYWGCPSIGKFFDEQGMIIFDDISELDEILNNLSEADYASRYPYIQRNYELAKHYLRQERYIHYQLQS